MNSECEKTIFAGIITYNPNRQRLFQNINAIRPQVNKIIIVDNGSDNYDVIQEIADELHVVIEVIRNNTNLGVAKALNQMMEKSLREGADWVLTLDQDSVVTNSIISDYSRYFRIPKIGMMTCILKDRNAKGLTVKQINGEYEDVNRCITSGCLTSVSAWNESGHFDEKMFIDFVDFDMCLSMREHGYRIIRVNKVGILHELGHSKDVRFNGKQAIVDNHSSNRKYYIIRNRLYYIKKHYKTINVKIEYKAICKYFLTTLIYEDNKISKLNAMIRGIVDSKHM